MAVGSYSAFVCSARFLGSPRGFRFLELDFSHEVVQTLCGTESQDKLRKLLGREGASEVEMGELRLAPDTPAEFRSYGVGASMAWHRDDQLYTIPQVECVFTVENLRYVAVDADADADEMRRDETRRGETIPTPVSAVSQRCALLW
eukprot:scaffold2324_cov266-Pinguiococcus_pyrenoidosus.AAC.5